MKKIKLNLKKLAAMSGLSFVMMTTSACGKKAECDVEGEHLHKYENSSGYVRYLDQEYIEYEGYVRSNEYIPMDESKRDLIKFEDNRNLLKISDNIDVIQKIQDEYRNLDHMEYQYRYTTTSFISNGKTMIPVVSTHYSWTYDSNRSGLTGKNKDIHYMFQAVKVEIDEHGNFVIIPGPLVDDVTLIGDEYPYILETYVKELDLNTDTYEESKTSLKDLYELRGQYPESFKDSEQILSLRN